MEKYVQVENVRMVFNTKKGPFVALRDINLSVSQGRVYRPDRALRLRQIDLAQSGGWADLAQ